MGDRYYLQIKCPECEYVDKDVYFAPTCGFVEWECEVCQHKIDLCKHTGITYEDASNAEVIEEEIKKLL